LPHRINSLDGLKQRLLSSKIAKAKDLKGCSVEEIAALESHYNLILPPNYKDYLSLIGHRAGCLVDPYEFSIYIDQLYEANDYVRNVLLTLDEDEDPDTPLPDMPEQFFVISARYGGDDIHFIVADGVSADAVYYLADSGAITEVSPSIWAWVEGFVKDAEHWIAEGRVDYGRYG